MKKRNIVLLMFVLIVTLFSSTSCMFLVDTEHEMADKNIMKLIDGLESGNKKQVKALFSKHKNAGIDIDKQIDQLSEYYNGTFQMKKGGGLGVAAGREGKLYEKMLDMTYEVTTSDALYYFAIYWCVEYSTDSSYLGIWSFYIINASEYSSEYTYRGDGLWTPGINIAVIINRDE